MPADRLEDLPPGLALRLEPARRRRSMQHRDRPRRLAGPLPQLRLVGIAERVVPGANVVPVTSLVRRKPQFLRPVVEKRSNASNVRESPLGYPSPRWEIDGKPCVSVHRY